MNEPRRDARRGFSLSATRRRHPAQEPDKAPAFGAEKLLRQDGAPHLRRQFSPQKCSPQSSAASFPSCAARTPAEKSFFPEAKPAAPRTQTSPPRRDKCARRTPAKQTPERRPFSPAQNMSRRSAEHLPETPSARHIRVIFPAKLATTASKNIYDAIINPSMKVLS